MGFNINEGVVRGDLFKKSGKWVHTVAIDMSEFYDETFVYVAVRKAVRKTPPDILGVSSSATQPGCGYYLVVLEPYHEHSYPVMLNLDVDVEE